MLTAYTNDEHFSGLVVKSLPAIAGDPGDMGSVPGLGRSPGRGNDSPLQYPCWETSWTDEPSRLQSIGLQRIGHN